MFRLIDLTNLINLLHCDYFRKIINMKTRSKALPLPSLAYIFALEDAFKDPYCVYAHEVAGAVIYVGVGTLARAFSILPRDRTDLWRRCVDSRPIRVGILGWHPDKSSALAAEESAILYWRPAANHHHLQDSPMPNGRSRREGRPVVCVETGQVYPSVSAAAVAIGVTQGAVTNVARGRYPSVKGLRFQYFNR